MMVRLSIALLGMMVGAAAESWESRDPRVQEFLAQGFDQKLDQSIPMDLPFVNDKGETIQIGSLFGERPVVLSMVYFRCPSICGIMLNGMVQSLSNIPLTVGRDFDVITLSFNPEETHVLASAKKQSYVAIYDREPAAAGWHWLTGDEANIRALTQAVGFNFKYDEQSGEYAHPAGIVLLTKDGKTSRYLFGSEFAPQDLRFALVDASDGKIGGLSDKVAMLCYRYNPVTGRYTLLIHRIVLVACLVTVACLAAMVWYLFKSDQARPKDVTPSPA